MRREHRIHKVWDGVRVVPVAVVPYIMQNHPSWKRPAGPDPKNGLSQIPLKSALRPPFLGGLFMGLFRAPLKRQTIKISKNKMGVYASAVPMCGLWPGIPAIGTSSACSEGRSVQMSQGCANIRPTAEIRIPTEPEPPVMGFRTQQFFPALIVPFRLFFF